MRHLAGRLTLAALTLALVPLYGCGSDPTVPAAGATVPVKGKVLYKGQPLAKGSVVFEPDGGREANGEIQADGTFELTTFKKGDGALPGLHRVGVTGSLKGKEAVPVKYRNPSSSKVEIEVSRERSEYTVDLK